MLRLVAVRALMSLALLIVISALTFFFQALIPGNAAEVILGLNARSGALNQLSTKLGLNEPVYEQYWHWLVQAVHGNLGTSYTTGQSVVSALNARVPVTLSVVIGATLVSTVVGLSLGILSANRGRHVRRTVDGISVLGLAVPNYWLGLVLIAFFALSLHLFPTFGYVSPGTSFAGWLHGLVLPVIALAIGAVTWIAKQTRDQMLEVLNRPFIHSLRANGASEPSVVLRHAARNAAIPVVTVIGLVFVGAVGGSILIEQVFVLPGLGNALLDATNQHDLPMIQGISVYFALIVIGVNFLVDLGYAWLNPKARTSR